MKKWQLWTSICTLFIITLFYIGSLFNYTGNQMKFNIPILSYNQNEYINWEESKMKQNPDYKNIFIFIDINDKTLELINLDTNEIVNTYPIASGKEETPSPIGNWKVVEKSQWGKGFGTRWMGLNVPWGKYSCGTR